MIPTDRNMQYITISYKYFRTSVILDNDAILYDDSNIGGAWFMVYSLIL